MVMNQPGVAQNERGAGWGRSRVLISFPLPEYTNNCRQAALGEAGPNIHASVNLRGRGRVNVKHDNTPMLPSQHKGGMHE